MDNIRFFEPEKAFFQGVWVLNLLNQDFVFVRFGGLT